MQITNTLKLIKFVVPETETLPTKSSNSLHHIWIVDRSGSMYSVMKDLIADLKQKARKLKTGDALTFGWFSSKGQYSFPIRIFKITDDQACFNELDKLFDANSSVLGMTNFSDILTECLKVIDESSFLEMKTSLLFFSDGYANHLSIKEEYKSVKEILPKLRDKVDAFITIGYGNYADYDFLGEMAEICGGEAVSANGMPQVTRLTEKWLRACSEIKPRIFANLSFLKGAEVVGLFSYSKEMFSIHTVDEEWKVPMTVDNPLYALVRTDSNTKETVGDELLYATALMLSKKGKINDALSVLEVTRDKYFMDKLSVAYTPSERSLINEELNNAIHSFSARRKNGWASPEYLPKEDAFCVLDLLNLLISDSKAVFFPAIPGFKYNPIGRKSKIRNGYPSFNIYSNNKCRFSDIIFNQEFLNASILTSVSGTINLPDSFEKEGKTLVKPESLHSLLECNQFKTYTFIKDGNLNITSLDISASESTIEKLMKEGVIANSKIELGKIYTLDLSKIPLVNQKIGQMDVTSKDLMSNFLSEQNLKAGIKIWKFLRNEINPDAPKVPISWTDEEREFLNTIGVRDDGSYNPPYDQEDATDVNYVVRFKLALKGLSSLPSVKDLRSRLEKDDGKSMPIGMEMMNLHYSEAKSLLGGISDQKKLIDLIDSKIKVLNSDLNIIRSRIQEIKFSLVLGRNWFSDLETMDTEYSFTMKYLQRDIMATISVERVEVDV